MTEDDVRTKLHRAIQAHDSQKAFAISVGVSAQYVADFLAGRRTPGPAILKALGLKKVVRYERETFNDPD